MAGSTGGATAAPNDPTTGSTTQKRDQLKIVDARRRPGERRGLLATEEAVQILFFLHLTMDRIAAVRRSE